MVFAIHQHELAIGIHVSPYPPTSLPLYPSRLSQSTGFGYLASNIELALVIYFTPPARGPGTLIPSAQRLVWAAKQPLGNAALGALFA